LKSPEHIAVIRLSAMGDVAMTVPVLLKLIKTYPDLKITVITRNTFKPLFSKLENVSVLEADVRGKHKRLSGVIKLAKEAKRLNITAVADLHNVIRSKVMRRYFNTVAIKTAKIDKGRSEKKAITKSKGKLSGPIKSTHERYADVFRKLGYANDLNPPVFLNKAQLPSNFKRDISKKLLGVAPFAAYKSKMYPLDLMRELLMLIEDRNQYQIVLFGSLDEKSELDRLAKDIKNVYNLYGVFSLEE